jgi:ubiquinone/menaquinone biosynthesis C-methylase UbiE
LYFPSLISTPAAVFAHTAQEEKDRMDIYHKIMEVARRGQLHQAPIYVNPNDPPRILDLGCGTGIWAIDMAE